MIRDIPNPSDFYSHGLNLLNVSWHGGMSLLTDLDNARYFTDDVDAKLDKYFTSAKPNLITQISIAQQGIEICLKGKIAELSPYLLIHGNPRDWPKNSDKKDIYFADFRTIDSQDLIKVYNTISKDKLPQIFIDGFNKLRKKRNTIVHTVDKRVNVHIAEIFLEILNAFQYLFTDQKWTTIRREYLKNSPGVHLYENFVETQIIWEFSLLIDLLNPESLKKYFNFNKRQRKYICPICKSNIGDTDEYPRTALLKPNSPKSENLYCFVCYENIPIIRHSCKNEDCNSNVISIEFGMCTYCGHEFISD